MNRSSRGNDIGFVYFDLGNVLVSFDPEVSCRNLSERFSVAVDHARAVVYESGLQVQFETGRVSPSEFAGSIRRGLGREEQDMPTENVLDAISDMFTPIESMRAVLGQVRESGRGVGLLSNTCHAHWDWIVRQRYPVLDFEFDVTVLSFEVGAMKPDPSIYQKAERASGVAAEQLLFLDDKAENTDAARRCGWNAVQCLGGEAAVAALRSFGVIDNAT